MDPLTGLGTEDVDPALAELDLMSSEDLVATALAREFAVFDAVRAQAGPITEVVERAVSVMSRGGRLVFVGAGTAGRIAALDATEIPPTFGVDPGMIVALVAGGDEALIDAREGDEDDAGAGSEAVRGAAIGGGDLVVGVSASGSTPYVVAALAEARRRGATTVALVNNAGTPLAAAAEHAIEVLTGPELVAGSTRLKAGTAQKIVLNLISTAVMVRGGRTFGNLMIAAAPVNAKLARRAVVAVARATGLDQEQVRTALADADGSAEIAILMLLAGLDAEQATDRLHRSGGRLRVALAATPMTGTQQGRSDRS